MPSPSVLLMLSLLAALPAVAESPSLPRCEKSVRYIELVPDADGKVPEVCIRSGRFTTMFFDSKVARVLLQGREWFDRVVEHDDALLLMPSDTLPEGKRLLLTVYFEDGAAPASANIELVVHPTEVDWQVEVSRRPRPVESYQQELRQVREELLQLQARGGGRGGFTGMISSGLVDEGGALARDLKKVVQRPGDSLTPVQVRTYRSNTRHEKEGAQLRRLAAELEVVNTGPTPWKTARAALVGPRGQVLEVLEPWQLKPIERGQVGKIVFELEATEKEAQGPFHLELWPEGDESRSVIFGGVEFP